MESKEHKVTGEREFDVSLQVDCRISITVRANNAEEAGDIASRIADNGGYNMLDLEVIETHRVNAYDKINNELTDLC